MTFATSLTSRCASHLLDAAVWAVSLLREVRHSPMTDDECEAEGLPMGSTYRCAFSTPVAGQSWWHLDAWVSRDAGGEDALRVDVLGHSLEVFFIPKRLQQGLAVTP